MKLTQLSDQPELTVEIGSQPYHFSELPIGTPERRGDPPYGLAALQRWITEHVPHPLDALRGHLDGLPPAVAASLAENARQESRHWPPQVGTAAGTAALLGTEPGQVEALYWGLQLHHPETTRDKARWVYRQLGRQALADAAVARRAGREYDGEGLVKRIFGVLFGLGELEDDGLKASGPIETMPASTGASSSGPVSDGCGSANGSWADTRSHSSSRP
jgi:hypothetical protein